MFWNFKKVKEVAPKFVRAKDLGLTYTERTVRMKFILEDQEYTVDKTFYISDYIDCKTVKEAKIKLDKDFENTKMYAENLIKDNIDKNDGYMSFNGFTVKNKKCSAASVDTFNNRLRVVYGCEPTPTGNGWPWKPEWEE